VGPFEFGKVVTDGEDDGVKSCGARAIKADFSAIEELKEADADEFFEKSEFVGVMGIEGRPVERGGFGDVLDGDFVELFLFEEALEGILQEAPGPPDTGIEPFAILVQHPCLLASRVDSVADGAKC
jgi:hypothetical protein